MFTINFKNVSVKPQLIRIPWEQNLFVLIVLNYGSGFFKTKETGVDEEQ